MYPRLYLARNILNDDGVIFVSISDEENKNLIKLLDEIYGEENQLACLIWNKQHSQQQGVFKKYHEYVLVYAKNKENINNISGGEGIIDAGALKKISRGNPASEFIFPAGIRFEAQDGTELTGTFGDSEKVTVIRGKLKAHNGKTTEEVVLSAGWTQKNQMTKYFNNEVVLDSKGQKVIEFYFNSAGKLKCKKERSRITPPTILPEYGMVSEQTAYIENLFGMSVFDNPKPVKMLQDFLNWFTDDGDIVVDFFAGSATMADSILTNGNAISFILVQLPEIINASSESGKNAIQMGYKTIADIGKERIRRVINKLNEKDSSVLTLDDPSIKDRGFKVLKLDKSNFKQWQTLEPSTTPEQIAEQLELHIDHINTEATQEDLLYEILLKAGFKLTEKVEIKTISNKTVYSVAEGALLLCLEETITKELIDAIVEMEPFRFYCLDSSFGGNDQLKANAVQTFNARNMQKEKHNQIAFKTI
jgi:adenine-specific DNA-methyltransferase